VVDGVRRASARVGRRCSLVDVSAASGVIADGVRPDEAGAAPTRVAMHFHAPGALLLLELGLVSDTLSVPAPVPASVSRREAVRAALPSGAGLGEAASGSPASSAAMASSRAEPGFMASARTPRAYPPQCCILGCLRPGIMAPARSICARCAALRVVSSPPPCTAMTVLETTKRIGDSGPILVCGPVMGHGVPLLWRDWTCPHCCWSGSHV
jgi:hypothetical protein